MAKLICFLFGHLKLFHHECSITNLCNVYHCERCGYRMHSWDNKWYK